MTNEDILARAVKIAMLANQATRGSSYTPTLLSVTSEIKEASDGSGGYELQWMAGIGEFSTYPRRYKTNEDALNALQKILEDWIKKGTKEGK